MENTNLETTKTYVLCMDVGGTSVKTGIVDNHGSFAADSMSVDPVDSSGTQGEILTSFAEPLEKGIAYSGKRGIKLGGIGISIGGPFDYENGISKIKDLDKYENIYDVNVKKNLQRMLGLDSKFPFLFYVDGWAFGKGEIWKGAARGFNRVIVFTMGTGVGSAFAVSGNIVSEGAGVPWYGWISGQKYKSGILNDYISRTYMINRYAGYSGEKIEVDEMAKRAVNGDQNAAAVFTEIGTTLGEFLRNNNLPEFKPECLVFGGQISKAFNLFSEPLKLALKEYPFIKTILPAADIEGSSLKGMAKFVFDSLGGSGT